MIAVFGGRSNVTRELSTMRSVFVFGRKDTFSSATFVSRVSLGSQEGIESACRDFQEFLLGTDDSTVHLVLLQGISTQNWNEAFCINLYSVALLAETLCEFSVCNKRKGSITFLDSASSTLGGKAAYCATKSGLFGLMNSLNSSYGNDVRTNIILPGAFSSGMISDWSEEKVRRISSKTYANRVAEPREIADSILFLMENEYMCGSVLNITSGQVR